MTLQSPKRIKNLLHSAESLAVSIAGQLHQQVKDLRPGSKISGLTFGDGCSIS